MVSPRTKFQELLKKLFQFDCAELDFGIYRIMNHKRAVIEQFIDKDLLDAVSKELSSGAIALESGLVLQMEEVSAQIRENFGFEALVAEGDLSDTYCKTPLGKKYQTLREQTQAAKSRPQREAEVFNHLYTFFGRYYDDGDFMSLRRYSRRDKYAIPYNGEEVHLHWANSDQYYIKTGENFTDYSYKHGGWTVRFKLRNADVERNNVKGDKRFFVPRTTEIELNEPVRTLSVPFEFRPLTAEEEKSFGKSKVQETMLDAAEPEIVKTARNVPEALAALLHEKRKDGDGNPVGLLAHHLRTYTRKNSSDFFIHKDLKGFLERELDFYLKNEVLNLDELEAGGEFRAEGWFQLMRTIKAIGHKIIAFVAQIEEFQKRLFEKKKFVTEVNYCVTLDRVPEELYPEIVKNRSQIEEWKRLFSIQEIKAERLGEVDYSEPLTVEFLKANPFLVLDTAFFESEYKEKLLSSIDKLDEKTDGLLVCSENLQVLNLLALGKNKKVTSIFIDPPYNTGVDGFPYKDTYQHSSWLAMMADRLRAATNIFSERGLFVASIDYVEAGRLRLLCDVIFGEPNFIADIAWEKRYTRSNNAKLFYSLKDTLLVYRKSELVDLLREGRTEKSRKHYTNPDGDNRGDWISSSYVNPAKKEERPNLTYTIINPFTKKSVDHPSHAWKYDRNSHEKHVAENRLYWGIDGSYEFPRLKTFWSDASDGMVPVDVWSYRETGTTDDGGNIVKALFGKAVFDNPKPPSLIQRSLQLDPAGVDTLALDFFAGSGTTGHAVIALNREDRGSRKYILVEMGEYFDTVLKPRIQKVIYSKDWKDGKPVSREGSSHLFKYLRLESYEDALDNITFQPVEQQAVLQFDDYVLSYMLDFETKGSETLLNVGKLDSPFDYTLRLQGKDEPLPVDLPETFNYLIGLHVATRRVYERNGVRYLVYRGTAEGRETVIIWRTTRDWGEKEFEADREFILAQKLTDGAEDVYVNCDSFLDVARSLDPVFKRRMFNGE